MKTPYPVGTTIALPAAFTQGGAPVTPDAGPTCVITKPDNIEVDLTGVVTIVNPGSYQALYTPAAPGLYRYRWTGGLAGVQAAESAVFEATALP